MAPMLSHHKTGLVETEAPSSEKREHNHMTLAVALARALYSASVLDRAILACFLQPQEIRLAPKKMQKTTYRATIIMTANPIRIQESLKRMSVRVIYLKSKTKGLF